MRRIKLIFFLICMLAAAALGAVLALKFYTGTDIKDAILRREITSSVSERISRLRATRGDVLELAVLESTLTFRDQDCLNSLPETLGKTITEISVPAVFRFYVKLSEPISVTTRMQGDTICCDIIAPKLRAATPVAFDTSAMRKRSEQGWLRFNRDEQLSDAERKISMRLAMSAPARARDEAVRSAARTAFEKFVREWLKDVKKLETESGGKVLIKIFFEDDADISLQTSLEEPAATPLVPVTI